LVKGVSLGRDAFGGAVVEPPKKARNLVETRFDQTFSGPVRALPKFNLVSQQFVLEKDAFCCK
jgi:hypothetical protein